MADVSQAKDLGTALLRLGDAVRAHVFKTGGGHIRLDRVIRQYDSRTRQEGFHVLHDWDGKAETVNEDTIPLDVLNYLIDKRGDGPPDTTVPAILLDYYFLYVLALLSLRVWDDGRADDHFDRLNELLRELQGPNGSGQRFVDDAATLVVIATSHYELAEQGYDRVLQKAGGLNHHHRLKLALVHAGCMGGHLRFGFEATYGRDTVLMRDDNGVDYPWVCFALATLMREYSRLHEEGVHGAERDVIVEAMLNGLSPDARAFVGNPPACLLPHEAERLLFFDLFHKYRQDLLEEFERCRPSDRLYSPFSLCFNFSYNVLKGMVVDALLRAEAWQLTLNDLFTGLPPDAPRAEAKEALAKTLMGYARASPDTIRGRLMPVIVYDVRSGLRAFTTTMGKIRE